MPMSAEEVHQVLRELDDLRAAGSPTSPPMSWRLSVA